VGEKMRTLGGRVGRASWVVGGVDIVEFFSFELLGSAIDMWFDLKETYVDKCWWVTVDLQHGSGFQTGRSGVHVCDVEAI
jgi:hypothetical protein